MSELIKAIAGYERNGCIDKSKALGIQSMPDGYALILNSDRTHYFWITVSLESCISWDKWATYRGAISHCNKERAIK